MSVEEELKAMETIAGVLDRLEGGEERSRVIAWASSRYGKPLARTVATTALTEKVTADLSDFPTLLESASPKNHEERVLVAAYWFAAVQGQVDLDSQSINTLLKNMGHGVSNITSALSGLMKRKPALVMQVRKSGSTKQARKKYRVTNAGHRAVEAMMSPVENEE